MGWRGVTAIFACAPGSKAKSRKCGEMRANIDNARRRMLHCGCGEVMPQRRIELSYQARRKRQFTRSNIAIASRRKSGINRAHKMYVSSATLTTLIAQRIVPYGAACVVATDHIINRMSHDNVILGAILINEAAPSAYPANNVY